MEDQGKIKVRCPYCDQKLRMDIELREVTCPKCNGQFDIEEESAPSMPEIYPAVKPAILIPPSILNPDEKNCPKCGATVKKEAIFCRHCKSNIQEVKKIACKCPACAESFNTEETNTGKKISCPICNQPITVKSSTPVLKKLTKSDPIANSGEFSFNRREKEFIISNHYSLSFALVMRLIEQEGYIIVEENPQKGLIKIRKNNHKWLNIYLIFSEKKDQFHLEITTDSFGKTPGFANVFCDTIENEFDDYMAGKTTLTDYADIGVPPAYANREEIDFTSIARKIFMQTPWLGGLGIFMTVLCGWFGWILVFAVSIMNLIPIIMLLSKIGNTRHGRGRNFAMLALGGGLLFPLVGCGIGSVINIIVVKALFG